METKITPTLERYFENVIEGESADYFINVFLFSQKQKKSLSSPATSFLAMKGLSEDDRDELTRIYPLYFSNNFTLLNPKEFLDNPYAKALKGISYCHDDILMKEDHYRKNELFQWKEKTLTNDYRDITELGYFDEDFPYPCLWKDGRVWMSLIPHEIKTMEEAIKKAKGKVLVYGFGLGYFAYMAARKEDVESVTVIESDPSIIAFYEEALSSLFPKEKMQIIEGDALTFASSSPKNQYDFLFADIWHDEEDGLPLYEALLKKEGTAKENHYWIETSLLVYARRLLNAAIEEIVSEDYDFSSHPKESVNDSYINRFGNYLLKHQVPLEETYKDSFLKKILIES